MLFEEMLQNEREAGRKEGLKEWERFAQKTLLLVLNTKGVVSELLSEKIMSESDFSKLEAWMHLAVQVSSVSEFESKM